MSARILAGEAVGPGPRSLLPAGWPHSLQVHGCARDVGNPSRGCFADPAQPQWCAKSRDYSMTPPDGERWLTTPPAGEHDAPRERSTQPMLSDWPRHHHHHRHPLKSADPRRLVLLPALFHRPTRNRRPCPAYQRNLPALRQPRPARPCATLRRTCRAPTELQGATLWLQPLRPRTPCWARLAPAKRRFLLPTIFELGASRTAIACCSLAPPISRNACRPRAASWPSRPPSGSSTSFTSGR